MLVEVSVVEQRYQAVLVVQSGVPVVEVAARFSVSRQSVHNWLAAYRDGGLAGLAGLETKSRRPDSSPWQAEVAVEGRCVRCGGSTLGGVRVGSRSSSAGMAVRARCPRG